MQQEKKNEKQKKMLITRMGKNEFRESPFEVILI